MQNLVFKMAHCFCKYKMGRRMNWGGDEDGGGEAPRGELTLPPQWRSPPSFLPQILPFLSLLGRRRHHQHSANQISGEGYLYLRIFVFVFVYLYFYLYLYLFHSSPSSADVTIIHTLLIR